MSCKKDLRLSMTVEDDIEETGTTSNRLEWISITMKNVFPKNGPLKYVNVTMSFLPTSKDE